MVDKMRFAQIVRPEIVAHGEDELNRFARRWASARCRAQRREQRRLLLPVTALNRVAPQPETHSSHASTRVDDRSSACGWTHLSSPHCVGRSAATSNACDKRMTSRLPDQSDFLRSSAIEVTVGLVLAIAPPGCLGHPPIVDPSLGRRWRGAKTRRRVARGSDGRSRPVSSVL